MTGFERLILLFDAAIEALVAAPEGKVSAGLIPSPGLQVCEIQSHNIKGDILELDKIEKLLEENTVVVTPAQGKLSSSQK